MNLINSYEWNSTKTYFNSQFQVFSENHENGPHFGVTEVIKRKKKIKKVFEKLLSSYKKAKICFQDFLFSYFYNGLKPSNGRQKHWNCFEVETQEK